MNSGAGFGAPGRTGSGGNSSSNSRKKAGGLSTFFLLAATALAGCYAYQHTKVNLGYQQTIDVTPTPAQIADTFLNKVAPEDARRNHRLYALDSNDQLKIDPHKKAFVRDLIIKYESLDVRAEDAELLFDGSLEQADLEYLRERIAYSKTVTNDPVLAAVSAVRDLETMINIREQNSAGFPHMPGQIEQCIRNLKFNAKYGQMSEPQARAVAERLQRVAVDDARRYLTIIDYTTDTKAAWDSGLRGYWAVREFTIAAARDANRANIPSRPLIEFIP